MRVLVTGGTGYVGSALVPRLAKRYEVRTLDTQNFGAPEAIAGVERIVGDVTDNDTVAEALKDCTHVVHLAGVVTDDLVDLNPAYGAKVNENATADLLRLAEQAGVARFVLASSSSIYGSTDTPVDETAVPAPETAYAAQKLEGDRLVLAHKGKMVTTALRLATMCGPAPRMRLDTIVNVFSKQAFYDGVIGVHDGKQVRSNVHVTDACHAFLRVLTAGWGLVGGRAFNVSDTPMTAMEIASLVRAAASSALGKDVSIEVDATKVDKRMYRMSAGRIADLLHWQPLNGIEGAVLNNFHHFASGEIKDPNADLYYNTARMRDVVMGDGAS